MDLPKRLFGGVDRAAAERSIAEQRRAVAELTEHLSRIEAQLEETRADRDDARSQLREMQAQIADVLKLATRAAQETEAETEARVRDATEQAQKRVDDLEVEASTAAEAALTLAEALQQAVASYRRLLPIDLDQESSGPGPVKASEQAPEEPFVLDEAEVPAVATPLTPPTPPAPPPPSAPAPPSQTTVVASPLPTPAAAVEIERRLSALTGVRRVTLERLTSSEATFEVEHGGDGLDLGPLVAAGVPVRAE